MFILCLPSLIQSFQLSAEKANTLSKPTKVFTPTPDTTHDMKTFEGNFTASGPKNMNDLVKHVSTYTDFNLLLAAQLFLPNSDSKDFVDRPTKRPIEKISHDFAKLQKELGIDRFVITEDDYDVKNDFGTLVAYVMKLRPESTDAAKVHALQKFIDENFEAPGSDLTEHPLEDFQSEPPFLSSITNENMRDVTLELNRMWKELSRVAVVKKGHESTLLNLPHPFIVPGGRFREFYYWDTYFILEGLVVSKMDKTASNIIKNFMHIIDTLGYIPNGTRKYYMYRSQPPFFPLMLLKLLDLNDGEYNDLILGKGLEMALKEYDFFDKYRSVLVKGRDGKLHKLNYFHVTTDFPRPESLSEDMHTYLSQQKLSEREVYSNLKSGAESGWDFSSRWFKDESDISTINAYNQIPVDLNAILFRDEQIISTLLKRAGKHDEARKFGDLSLRRMEAINQVLWNKDVNSWNDYDTENNKFVARRFYFSNVFPLIMGVEPPTGNIYNVLQAYQRELFSYIGGVPVSGPGKDTGQQWDFPNVWAPHQFLIVEFLYNKGEHKMALQIARAFYNSVSTGFKQKGVFYEKYNAEQLGFTGEGGEYAAQTGFGWTNGTALSFISKFKDQLAEAYDHQKEFKEIVELLAKKVNNENLGPANKTNVKGEKKPNLNVMFDIKTKANPIEVV
ncbi:Neutral trehalase [Trachipleistophora hominis]|uniref:Trehalase n=1 Tax=Trachipleistophora hominis TaxID=72359 RepID=L7JS22_TRAHO|nr:Neutral trehalase [Trachipleistophora hominis]